ncbi:hypothetical protein DM860_007257 [Cuscuta australis]|uniref:Peptidase S9A N-terminal domain-containing protein n=1 Tax=Cuscuta australis TaxID=267555 RepID=A0A328E4G9_9ASTE|nr:hypothetical protein DM860_007257 [Cuscuta australis]
MPFFVGRILILLPLWFRLWIQFHKVLTIVPMLSKDVNNLDAGTETNANLHHELYYHFLGTDQCEDILCWKDLDNPKHSRSALVTEDGKDHKLIRSYGEENRLGCEVLDRSMEHRMGRVLWNSSVEPYMYEIYAIEVSSLHFYRQTHCSPLSVALPRAVLMVLEPSRSGGLVDPAVTNVVVINVAVTNEDVGPYGRSNDID